MVAFLDNMFQIGTLAFYICCMPLVLWQKSYQCVSYLGLFCITDHKYWMSYIIFTMLAYSMSYSVSDTHLLYVCVCIVCPAGAVFGTGHLTGSWSLIAQGCMLDWLGSVTFTVSFCQPSGGVYYPTNCKHNVHASYDPIRHTRCVVYAFCIIFDWYFALVLFYFV